MNFTIRNKPENKMKIALIVLLPLLLGSCSRGGKMDNEALKLLRKSEKKFNETYAGKEIDLLHMDFTDMKIKGANLTGANMKGAMIKNTIFKDCILEKADLSASYMEATTFENCQMSEIKMTGGGSGLQLVDCVIKNAYLHQGRFTKVQFKNSDLSRSVMTNITMEESIFDNSEVQDCKIMGSKITEVFINNTNFIGSNLTDSVFQGKIMEDSSFFDCTLTRTNFSGSTFKGQLFSEPDFGRVDAKNVNFSHCYIYGFSAMGGADFENADFSNSRIELLEIQSGNLKNAKFMDTYLKSINFNNSDLTQADFSRGAFENFIILSDTKLEGTVFDHVALLRNPEIELENTIYEGKTLPGTRKVNPR